MTNKGNKCSFFVCNDFSYLYRNKKILKVNNKKGDVTLPANLFSEQIILLNDIINLDNYVFLENHVYLDRK